MKNDCYISLSTDLLNDIPSKISTLGNPELEYQQKEAEYKKMYLPAYRDKKLDELKEQYKERIEHYHTQLMLIPHPSEKMLLYPEKLVGEYKEKEESYKKEYTPEYLEKKLTELKKEYERHIDYYHTQLKNFKDEYVKCRSLHFTRCYDGAFGYESDGVYQDFKYFMLLKGYVPKVVCSERIQSDFLEGGMETIIIHDVYFV
jgi:hypothetical protein